MLSASLAFAQFRRGGGYYRRPAFATLKDFDGGFQFCRIAFRQNPNGDGGGWSADGQTLPGTLDIEYTCNAGNTAGTLAKAAEVLKERGAKKVVAYCTHPVLSGAAVDRVKDPALDELVVIDTIPLSEAARRAAEAGESSFETIEVEGVRYGPIEARIERVQGDNTWLTIAIKEGKNREVKRICEHLGLQVNRLIRTAFGPFQLGELARGGIEEVPTRAMKSSIGEKFFKKEDDAHRRWKVQRP